MFSIHNHRRQLLPLILIVLLALALSACGGGGNGNSTPAGGNALGTPAGGAESVPNTGGEGEATVVNVSMTTYAFELDPVTVPAGMVTFHVTNDAEDMGHELIVLKTDIPGSELPTNADGVVEEEQLENLGEVEAEVQESKDLTVDLEPGHYVLLCNEPGHYANQMYLDIDVQ